MPAYSAEIQSLWIKGLLGGTLEFLEELRDVLPGRAKAKVVVATADSQVISFR